MRLYEESIIISFEQKNQYDDIPSLATAICEDLNLKIKKIIDGPSERIVEFTEPNLVLVNNPYGSELRSTSKNSNHLLKVFCEIFLEKHYK